MSQKKIYCFILYVPFSNPVCISRFTCPCVCPSRISRVYQDHLTLSESPNFLRSAYPYPGCRLSSFTGSCPMENISAGYRLILWFCCY